MNSCRRSSVAVLAAGLGLAATPLWAQYSTDVVGYINEPMKAGWTLTVNQLSNASNHANQILATPGVPDGACLYRFDGASQSYYNAATYYTNVGWWPISGNTNDMDLTLPVGEGFFVWSPREWTNTFTGEVLQGTLVNPLPQYYSLKGSMVPIKGGLTSTLEFPAAAGDKAFFWQEPSGPLSEYDFDGAWSPTEPVPGVAQGFMVYTPTAKLWVLTFYVPTSAPVSPVATITTASINLELAGTKIQRLSVRNSGVRLEISNPMSSAYDVQFSTDGVNWQTVGRNARTATWEERLRDGKRGFYKLVRSSRRGL